MENVRKLALYLVLTFAVVGGLVTINQTLADHSGLFGLAFTSAWLFPMVIPRVKLPEVFNPSKGTNFLSGLLEILYKSPKVASLLTTRLLS